MPALKYPWRTWFDACMPISNGGHPGNSRSVVLVRGIHFHVDCWSMAQQARNYAYRYGYLIHIRINPKEGTVTIAVRHK